MTNNLRAKHRCDARKVVSLPKYFCVTFPQVRIDSLCPHWAGSLQIGMTAMAISDNLPTSILPDSAVDLRSKVTWVVCGSEVRKNGEVIKENYAASLDRLEVSLEP